MLTSICLALILSAFFIVFLGSVVIDAADKKSADKAAGIGIGLALTAFLGSVGVLVWKKYGANLQSRMGKPKVGGYNYTPGGY